MACPQLKQPLPVPHPLPKSTSQPTPIALARMLCCWPCPVFYMFTLFFSSSLFPLLLCCPRLLLFYGNEASVNEVVIFDCYMLHAACRMLHAATGCRQPPEISHDDLHLAIVRFHCTLLRISALNSPVCAFFPSLCMSYMSFTCSIT